MVKRVANRTRELCPDCWLKNLNASLQRIRACAHRGALVVSATCDTRPPRRKRPVRRAHRGIRIPRYAQCTTALIELTLLRFTYTIKTKGSSSLLLKSHCAYLEPRVVRLWSVSARTWGRRRRWRGRGWRRRGPSPRLPAGSSRGWTAAPGATRGSTATSDHLRCYPV